MTNRNREILAFLRDLSNNNNRPWFVENKPRYEVARQLVLDQTAWLIAKIGEFDPTVRYLEPKDCLFRIYRDVRFSPNKRPYKEHFGTYICMNGGHKSLLSGYYLHIQPEASALCGGIYCADKDMLRNIRTALDIDYDEFQRIEAADDYRQYFGKMFSDDVLKKMPQGFSPDSPAAEYLKFKTFFVQHSFTDDEVCAPDFLERLLPMCRAMKPFNDFMNAALTDNF